jgi:hypothetical protein
MSCLAPRPSGAACLDHVHGYRRHSRSFRASEFVTTSSFLRLRLLLILLSALEQLKMPRLLRHERLSLANQAGTGLVLDLVLLDERCFLGLYDACARAGLLLPIIPCKHRSQLKNYTLNQKVQRRLGR